MLRAVPATMRMALSTVKQFRSLILSLAIEFDLVPVHLTDFGASWVL